MNLSVGDSYITADKDPKHIIKRCQNLAICKAGVLVYGVHITPSSLRLHLKEAGMSHIRLDYLLNPSDWQDVPVAFSLLKEIWSLGKSNSTDTPAFTAAREALRTLAQLFRHLVIPFIQVTLSLHEQLQHLSAAAHLATFLFTTDNARSKAIQSLTYKDIILMVKNTYFCVAKAKISAPNGSFWIILLGTNRLEEDFGDVRTIVGSDANPDMSSLTTRLSHAVECRNIFSKHPEWDRSARRLRLRGIEDGNGDVLSKVDHIKPASWQGNVTLSSVVLATSWNSGRQLAASVLESIPTQVFRECFLEMEKKGYDMLYPFGNGDKLNDDETMEDELGDIPAGTSGSPKHSDPVLTMRSADTDALQLGEGDGPSLSFEDHAEIEIAKEGKHSPLVDVGDGKMIPKARVLRELERAMFSKIAGSTD